MNVAINARPPASPSPHVYARYALLICSAVHLLTQPMQTAKRYFEGCELDNRFALRWAHLPELPAVSTRYWSYGDEKITWRGTRKEFRHFARLGDAKLEYLVPSVLQTNFKRSNLPQVGSLFSLCPSLTGTDTKRPGRGAIPSIEQGTRRDRLRIRFPQKRSCKSAAQAASLLRRHVRSVHRERVRRRSPCRHGMAQDAMVLPLFPRPPIVHSRAQSQ